MSNAVATPTPAPMDREAAETLQPGTERLLASGDVLRGRYRVQGLLGQGGMGTVFEAIDEYRLDLSNGDQRVALKVLHTAVIQRPRLFAELRREFQHLQSLSHPNIVRVHEFDRDGDMAFFTMEYLSGALLSRLLFAHQSASLHRPFALAIVRDVGAAVAYAHARGVVHGDLNPENIFITDNGEVRVLDFSASHQLRRGPWISEFENPQQITVATPTYASCQLLEGETADVRDDIYALACLAYALLTGNHPFGQYSALRARTLRLTPDRPSGLSGRQWNALRAGLHFARDRRPPDMQAWLERLDFRAATVRLPALPTLLTMRPRRPTGMLRWALNGALVALIVACAWWAATHADSLANAAGAVGAKVKSTFANTVGHMGDTRHENGGDIPPADVPARSAPAVEGTRSAALAAHDAPSPHGPLPPPVNALAETHGASRAPANITPPITVSTAPAAASAAATSGAPGPTGSSVHARIELASDTVEVAPTQPVAYVVVHRSRSLRGDVAFNWWTESGTAKPGRDFVPVKYRVEHIEDGKNSANLVISIVSDPARHDSRSFYVVIDEASDNAALGARTLTMVTIPGSE